MLLFGGALEVDKKRQAVSLQTIHPYRHWLRFTASPNLGALVKLFRAEVERLLLVKAEDPAVGIQEQARVIQELVANLLEEEAAAASR